MHYKLARPEFPPEMISLIKREMKKQKLFLAKASPKMLGELAAMVRVIETRELPEYLVCKKLPEPFGMGIFLHPEAKALLKGTIIGSYGGEVYIAPQYDCDESAYAFAPLEDMKLLKEEQLLLDKKRTFHPRRLYLLNIDADKNGNFTRFINHSEKPNIEARLLTIPKNKVGLKPSPLEVIYLVKHKVLPGQQLLVSYEDGEDSYWGPLKMKPEAVFAKTFMLDENLKLMDGRKK